jgi:hypothetical protein
LIIEAIRIYGQDMYYIPRVVTNYDKMYTEDDQSAYSRAHLVELYIKSVDGFSGDGSFMSKFGIEIRDQVIFSMSQRIFNQEIGLYTKAPRPFEGDLIYFPLNRKCFQIKFVNKFEMFYQLGSLQTWEMTCELFEYSNEILNTGVPEVDSMQKNLSTDILDYSLMDENGNYLTNENDNYLVVQAYDLELIDSVADNDIFSQGTDNFKNGSNNFIDFSQVDPFSEGHM